MAPSESSQSVATLRAITSRLSSTPTEQLPQSASQIAGLLWNCRNILSSSGNSGKQASDALTTVNRFRTQLSTLLQSRTVGGRWAAVVITKAAVEAGGLETLAKSTGWVRNLLSILKRPDPPSTRTLVVITLTRIFMLTWDYTNLVREITTPALPTFIATCLHNAESLRCSASELETILEAFATLVPRHPTILRTLETKIRSLLNKIISSPSSNVNAYYATAHIDVAQRLLVSLHHCQPKQGGSERWDETVMSIVSAAHATCDRVFRSVNEAWHSTTGVQPSVQPQMLNVGEAELEGEDAAGLASWKGVFAGSERLMSLLDLLRIHLVAGAGSTVNVRIGQVMDLLTRLFTLTVPHQGRQGGLQFNPQISKDERETLFMLLPRIRVSALHLVGAMLDRFGVALASVVQPLLELVSWMLRAEKSDDAVRAASYQVFRSMLELGGPNMSKDDIADIASILFWCCEDLLPASDSADQDHRGPGSANGRTLQQKPGHVSCDKQGRCKVRENARALLPVMLSKIDARHTPRKLRAQMDRTAILTRDKNALLASVLNPQPSNTGGKVQPSLLPILARLFPNDAEVEALVRPRMPTIPSGRRVTDDAEVNGYHENVIDEAEDEEARDGAVEQDDEPADLLSALENQVRSTDPPQESEDLYSASPPHQPRPQTKDATAVGVATDGASTAKRTAAEELHQATSVKRLRASPVAASLLPDTTQQIHGPNPDLVQAPVPTTVVLEQPSQLSAEARPSISTQKATMLVQPQTPADGVGGTFDINSDGSDFEIPPLTLEQDTEPEDEDGDEGD